MGRPMDFENPEFLKLYGEAIRQVRAAGKVAATAAGHPRLIDVALESGIQIIVCAAETGAIRQGFTQTLKDVSAKIRR